MRPGETRHGESPLQISIILRFIHIGNVMKKLLKARKQFVLSPSKIARAQRVLKARTATETINRALDDVILADEVARRLKKMAGHVKLENMDQSSFLE